MPDSGTIPAFWLTTIQSNLPHDAGKQKQPQPKNNLPMKIKPAKMTTLEKAKQNSGSRFIKVIPSYAYSDWRRSSASKHVFDDQGRRIR